MSKVKEWFGEWFDSPYYHILYKHRDHDEAQGFIDTLINHFHFSEEHKILDLACGKGRHSIYLNKKGFNVVGVDLSEQNILHAQKFENDRLKFLIHDMRHDFAHEEFDYVLNMFTSFGYFESNKEHQEAICTAATALKPGGKLVIDFLNPYTVINDLVPEEIKLIDDIEFHITKTLTDDDYIIKEIKFHDNGHDYAYQEKVKAIRRMEFLEYFDEAKLNLIDVYGDYNLNFYQNDKSPRMIFVVEK